MVSGLFVGILPAGGGKLWLPPPTTTARMIQAPPPPPPPAVSAGLPSCADKATPSSAALRPCWNAAADVQLHPMAVLCSIFSSGRHYACTESSPRHFGARVYESTNAIVAVQLRSALTVRMPKVVYFDSFQRRCARRTELISWLLICGSQKYHLIWIQVAQAKRLLFAELRVANLKRLLRMEAAFASAEVGAFGSA